MGKLIGSKLLNQEFEPRIEHIVHVSGIDNKAWNVQSKETTHQKII